MEHEGGDEAVDGGGGVEARGAEGEEVVGGFGGGGEEELEVERAVGCVELVVLVISWVFRTCAADVDVL